MGAAYGVPTVALRFFNIYGSGQALSNPYTGVAAIFSSRLLNSHAPPCSRTGSSPRDFIHVSDIVRAIVLALESEDAVGHAVNVGTGRPVTVRGVAELLAARLDMTSRPSSRRRTEWETSGTVSPIQPRRGSWDSRRKYVLEEGIGKLLD